ncbi:MAG: Zn-dependent oligopeptidase, partial [Methanomicrobiales archaeon]|nr:Zn-dependent oligopeptidase [Methanomicrobiales archaeon]
MPVCIRPSLIVAVSVLLLLLILAAGCTRPAPAGTPESASMPAATPAPVPVDEIHLIRAHYQPGEITNLSAAAEKNANASFNAIAALAPEQRTPDNTLIAFSVALTDYSDAINPLTIMGQVSPDPAIAAEGMKARESGGIFITGVSTRRDLYNAIKDAQPRTPDEARLYNLTMLSFELNGLKLPDDQLARVREKMQEVSRLETRYNANLNNDVTSLVFTREELAGVPEDDLESFARTPDGKYRVTMSGPDYSAVMRNARNSETRKAVYVASNNVMAEENTRLLAEAVRLRYEIAQELGYPTWADYQLDGRMAKNPAAAMAFLEGMKKPLQEKSRDELADLLVIKKTFDPSATSVDAWDISWLLAQQKILRYSYDENEVKEYFPADTVVSGMFRTCGTLFGIRFDEVKGADVWADDVRLFRVSNTSDNATVGYLYLDLYPRAGKTDSVFETELRTGRMKDGSYSVPIVIVVDKIPAPAGDKPSLLTTGETVTLFHETGHAMHSLLTRVPYGTLAGNNVQWDFVETPSQSLEEWFYDPEVMVSISGHYANSSEKLPAELRDRIIAAKDAGNGRYFSSQLVYSLYDLQLHAQKPPIDPTALYYTTYYDVMEKPLLPGLHVPASFGHIMGGYDAGYYGYLWSKVY